MFGYLLFLFTVVPAVELLLLIEIGSHIGGSNTIIIIILTGVIGAYLARLQGFFILRNIQSNLQQGVMPTEEMLDGLMVLVGGIVLLTPGFITDTFGLLLLLPPTRLLIKKMVRRRFDQMVQGGQINTFRSETFRNRGNLGDLDDDVEDADYFDDK